MKLSNSDLKKFSRQIIIKKIGINGQKKINNSRVLIIGMGGLGCPLLIYLANSGVKKIGIVDDDLVEKYAPNIVEGTNKLVEWSKTL